jgi:hypothetical protein
VTFCGQADDVVRMKGSRGFHVFDRSGMQIKDILVNMRQFCLGCVLGGFLFGRGTGSISTERCGLRGTVQFQIGQQGFAYVSEQIKHLNYYGGLSTKRWGRCVGSATIIFKWTEPRANLKKFYVAVA